MHEQIVTVLVNHILLEHREKDVECCRKELTELGFYKLDTLTRENLILKAHNRVVEMYLEKESHKKRHKNNEK